MKIIVDLDDPKDVAAALKLLGGSPPTPAEAPKEDLRAVLKTEVIQALRRIGKGRMSEIAEAMGGATVSTHPDEGLAESIEAIKQLS